MIQEPDWNTWGMGSAVPLEIRAEIGSVVIYQASIEYGIQRNIARLLGIDHETIEVLTAELSFKQLMALMSSLVIKKIGKESPLYEDFAQAAGQLDQFEAFRNAVAHSHWTHSVVDNTFKEQATRHKSTAKRGQGLRRAAVEVSLQEIEIRLKKAGFFNGELFKLIGRISSGAA